jgi:hypothetical protein
MMSCKKYFGMQMCLLHPQRYEVSSPAISTIQTLISWNLLRQMEYKAWVSAGIAGIGN